jgi:hypothetical protein
LLFAKDNALPVLIFGAVVVLISIVLAVISNRRGKKVAAATQPAGEAA